MGRFQIGEENRMSYGDDRSGGGGFGGGSGRGDRGSRDSKDKKKPRRSFGGFRKKRPPATLKFDYKNIYDLMPFITEEGKIIPARVSGLSAHQQRGLTLAVKRARNIGFLSPVRRECIR